MSEWRGLHNPDWHNPQANGRSAICRSFYCYSCSEHDPCPCCLKAEVERLTAALADRDRRINKALALHAERAVGDLHYCQSCMADATGEYEYPCPTVQALRGES